jgi:hypothetical protein
MVKAFDFGRAFLWKWTVNWRFIDEEIFLSREFAWSLLAGHALTLALFILTRWLKYISICIELTKDPQESQSLDLFKRA